MLGSAVRLVDSGYLNLCYLFIALPQLGKLWPKRQICSDTCLVHKVSLEHTHTCLFMDGLQSRKYLLSYPL